MKLETPEQLEAFNLDWLTGGISTPAAPTPIMGPLQVANTPAAAKPSWLQTLSTTAQQVLPGLATTVLGIKQQQALNKINIARAQTGQAPLDIAQYQEASAPVIKVQGGVDSGTSSKMMYAGLALGGALALAALLKNKGSKNA